ncbi:TolB-like protein [Maribacter spongiicola]|uniref:TolB-like protein n=1 Tax=Maribacter spongiicola TaxID=1206753 RepID=A0A4R7K7G1_9FLAO|nr:helix-turn-helix domain-containing protein [Maribacter spongiicola]TDT47010.1 TolB-like protein [Maribacter spongiicola]
MSNPSVNTSTFIEQAEALILENLANEQFGVSELAEATNMSRSNLLRKIKKQTKLSASQFIRQVRLKEAMDLLNEGSSTVSEVSYQVGFGSTSYFIKCFREHYGYPPGEVGKVTVAIEEEKDHISFLKRYRWAIIAASCAVILLVSSLLFNKKGALENAVEKPEIEKSIAVLPFKNESADSTNLYFVNGLMESALNNLQKIEDLRVISRTSVEKYRKTDKGIPEIAEELHVNYLVEGSGQRVGNQVLLNVQLINASTDTPIWVKQYSREVKDVFELQNDVAKKIADAITAVITPAELEQIDKKPTENLLAYDYYLKALDPYYSRSEEGLEKAISLFEKAIEQDSEFALAYANIAISYYLLEMSQIEKQYTDKINSFADKALLYDSKSAESLVAKAFYYIQTKEYKLALPYLDKALEYNPNSSLAVQMLSEFYSHLLPNTSKYLEYALKGVQLTIASDSITQSYTYLQLSNALVSSGFADEALKYINKSLDYNAENFYAPHLKAFILFAKDGKTERTRSLLKKELEKDSTRLDILQDIGKLYYIDENYDSAYFYYEKFVKARALSGQDIYPQENIKIATVYKKMGLEKKAEKLFNDFSEYCEKDQSIYKSVNLVWKYAYEGKVNEAIEQLRIFSETENYLYWFLLIEDEPSIQPLKSHPEFAGIMQKIKDRFWKNQTDLKMSLHEEDLL